MVDRLFWGAVAEEFRHPSGKTQLWASLVLGLFGIGLPLMVPATWSFYIGVLLFAVALIVVGAGFRSIAYERRDEMFVDISQAIWFRYGTNTWTCNPGQWTPGQWTFKPIPFGGNVPIVVAVKGNRIRVSVRIWNGSGQPAVELRHNKFIVRPINWDSNSNANALEVVDENQAPVFQLIKRTPSQLIVNGVFPMLTGVAVLSEAAGMHINPSNMSEARKALKPIFLYPAWKHRGQYAPDPPNTNVYAG
jgi:hypothetical protein